MGEVNADEKPDLIYFPCFGRAGVAKLCFRLGNVDFVDSLEAWDTWWTRKTGKHAENRKKFWAKILEFPLGQIPIMKIGEEVFCQQKAIEQFAAEKAGLAGKSDLDQMKIDMVIETMNEITMTAFLEGFAASTDEFPVGPAHPLLLAGWLTDKNFGIDINF